MFALMERGAVDWQERVAWEQLRIPAKRLLVDARMFRLREPDVLGQQLATLTPAEKSSLSRLCARLPADAPLLTLLAGDRAGATALWRQRLADHPDDQHVVHCLGLVSFWHARELEETGAWQQAAPVWRTALACLATLLTNDEFWTGWRQDRASRYGHAVTPADTRMLRIEFGRYLISTLTGHTERHADAGRAQEAERCQRLVTLFEAELEAAQCLSEIGGLPLRGGGLLSCGPEYVRLADLAVEFGEFIAERHKSDFDDTSQGLLSRLRCAFSALSHASSLVDHHRFEAALRMLPDYHRSGRAELPDDCAGPDRHGGVGACPHCREFLRQNPAYTYLADRRVRLLGDAVGLAVRARLSIARELLTGHQLDAAMAELTGAIDIAANALIGARAQGAGLRIIVGRVDALAESNERNIAGVDEAIELVERAIPVFFDADRHTLVKKLADLLVNRGVWYGSACSEFGLPTDLARAVGELRRAFELDPDSTWVRYNLAQGLIRYSERMPTFADRIALLIEALCGISDGLDRAGPSVRLNRALRLELDRLGEVLVAELSIADMHELIQSFGVGPAADLTGADLAQALAEEARRLRADGDLIRAAHLLVRAVRADPADWRYRADLLATLEDLLTERRDGGSAHA
jgi:tetratricopeptide (TPR) repeat protein